MKKVLAIVMAVMMLATMGGVALAQSAVEPEEVNIVLPTGEEAEIVKYVTNDEGVTVNITWAVDNMSGLAVDLSPAERLNVADGTSANFTEIISIFSWTGPEPLYATVTFFFEVDGIPTSNVTQRISVTEGNLDIKPGSFPNSISCKKKGVTPVAILGNSVNVSDIDVTTIEFMGASPVHDLTDPDVLADHIQDVNFDGNPDLVCHFPTSDLDMNSETETGTLTYELETDGGASIDDSVRPLKCPGP